MRKLAVTLFAVLLVFATAAVAQENAGAAPDKKTAKAEKKEAKAAEKGKTLSLTGWVKTEGEKTVFVNDKDKQTWDVQNPDAVKAENGKHVRVKAKLDEVNKSINVSSVKELGKCKQSGEEKAKKG